MGLARFKVGDKVTEIDTDSDIWTVEAVVVINHAHYVVLKEWEIDYGKEDSTTPFHERYFREVTPLEGLL